MTIVFEGRTFLLWRLKDTAGKKNMLGFKGFLPEKKLKENQFTLFFRLLQKVFII